MTFLINMPGGTELIIIVVVIVVILGSIMYRRRL